MKCRAIYRGILNEQSEFSHRYACWAINHQGWAKMKKLNKRIAKKRLKEEMKQSDEWRDGAV